jgi:energy-coupling factor transporter ATP-binding protein EcfA2
MEFEIGSWGDNDGLFIMVYGPSGRGKSTLASLLDNVIFVAVDEGVKRIKSPKTGERIPCVRPKGQKITFEATRAILQNHALFADFDNIVIDTGTKLEHLAEDFVLENFKKTGGDTAKSLKHYGYGDGFGHLETVMRYILGDIQELVALGKNVIMLCQADDKRFSNAELTDEYLKSAPALYHDRNHSVMLSFYEEADFCFRLDYDNVSVVSQKAFGQKKIGRAVGGTSRAIFVADEPHFFAKCRDTKHGFPIPGTVAFDDPTDDSIWVYLFDGVDPEELEDESEE